MNRWGKNNNSITSWEPTELTRILHCHSKFIYDINRRTFTATIQFIKDHNRFDQSLI